MLLILLLLLLLLALRKSKHRWHSQPLRAKDNTIMCNLQWTYNFKLRCLISVAAINMDVQRKQCSLQMRGTIRNDGYTGPFQNAVWRCILATFWYASIRIKVWQHNTKRICFYILNENTVSLSTCTETTPAFLIPFLITFWASICLWKHEDDLEKGLVGHNGPHRLVRLSQLKFQKERSGRLTIFATLE